MFLPLKITKQPSGFLNRVLWWMVAVILCGGAFVLAALIVVFSYYNSTLPEFKQLAEYEPLITTRVHAGDGRLLAEFATEQRIFVPIEAVPEMLRNAFISAEDQRFYSHPGIDIVGIIRAIKTDIGVVLKGRGQLVGASTITQQVAKNFLLTNQRTLQRKVKEVLLAVKIERILSKNDILELYLNEIYLGQRSYGVAAAALQYFDKSLEELTLAEMAYIAALPKAPNNYNVKRFPEAAKGRRDWVVGRMLEEKYITDEDAVIARNAPLQTVEGRGSDRAQATYFVEEVRRRLIGRYSEEGLYESGLSVRTSLNPHLQNIGQRALRKALRDYDRRHGYRGVLEHLEEDEDMELYLAETQKPLGSDDAWFLTGVVSVTKEQAEIVLDSGERTIIELGALKWARSQLDPETLVGEQIASELIGNKIEPEKQRLLGRVIARASQLLQKGDIILTSRDDEGKMQLEQIPEIEGALVALDPHTGRIFAMAGGWDFKRSEFNRATQALRQPGSAFKPFVYLTALEQGYTPSTRILDAPFVAQGKQSGDVWKPDNFSQRFYGPSPMRVGIERSRNLMTVRLADAVGMTHISEIANRFGIMEDMPLQLVMALGAGETSLLSLTTAYAILANGGKKITPTLIDRIQDRNGVTVFKNENRLCFSCNEERWSNQPSPDLTDDRIALINSGHAYQVVSMLEGVVRRGTGARVGRAIKRPLAGKTGTTNQSRDTWFVGFSPNLVTGVFIGFDIPRTLGVTRAGSQETASNVAAPVFTDFMKEALADRPVQPFRVPNNIILVKINAETGGLSSPGDARTVLEAFRAGSEPVDSTPGVLIGTGAGANSNTNTFFQQKGQGAEQEILEGLY